MTTFLFSTYILSGLFRTTKKDLINEMISKRQTSNYKILNEIRTYISRNSSQRFIQVLWNLNLITREDKYHEESTDTLEILSKLIKEKTNG